MTKTTCDGSTLRSLGFVPVVGGILLFGAIASPALAQPSDCTLISRSASGPNAAAIQAEVDAFRVELGPDNGTDPTSHWNGRRDITWEDDSSLSSQFGAVLSSAVEPQRFQVSAHAGGSTPPRFGDINPLYPTIFQAFSGERLFTPLGTNRFDVSFVIPSRFPDLFLERFVVGRFKPAAVRAFGAVFVDVGAATPSNSYMVFYGTDGARLGTIAVPPFAGGLSFAAGIAPCQPIGRVRIQLGTGVIDGNAQTDVVVMDNIIYSEPRRLVNETLDFDGDGTADFAVYRPDGGGWYVLSSRTKTVENAVWGLPDDVPVPGDYDGDGRTDFAVFRPSTGEWLFFARPSLAPLPTQVWGQAGDIAVPFDYDHDGKVDIAVWRASAGIFFIKPSSLPFGDYAAIYWGQPGDIPLMSRQ